MRIFVKPSSEVRKTKFNSKFEIAPQRKVDFCFLMSDGDRKCMREINWTVETWNSIKCYIINSENKNICLVARDAEKN